MGNHLRGPEKLEQLDQSDMFVWVGGCDADIDWEIVISNTILDRLYGAVGEAIFDENAAEIAIVDEGHGGRVWPGLVSLILEIGVMGYELGW